jgi:hypothetical protein
MSRAIGLLLLEVSKNYKTAAEDIARIFAGVKRAVRQTFKKYHKIPSSGLRVIPAGPPAPSMITV